MNEERRSKLQALREEFLQTTDTLWDNEVNANLMVARTMIGTAGIALLILVLSIAGVFSIRNTVMVPTMLQATVELLVPAILCLVFKGQKKWLKSLMMLFYTIVLARIQTVLGHNVVLCMVFPVVLSVRYYSRFLTSFISVLTVALSGIAEYLGVAKQFGRLDLNMVELPAGITMQTSTFSSLRDVVPVDQIDYNHLFQHTMQHSYLPRLILFSMVAVLCAEIAKRGRMAIFAQKAETEKSARLSTELDLASQIQNNVLPNIFPVYPERKEFSLYASMTAAKEVGGDFYDFFMIDDDHLGLVMADVSGKGVPAALFMMVARTLIKNRTLMGGTPSEILADVNNQLCEGNVAELFVTVWLGILQISTGKGVAANAGHEHPALRKKGDEYQLVVYRHSPAVAAMEDMVFAQHEFQLEPGDSIFVYTDGVAEATNASNELMGTDRMLEALNKAPDAVPEDVLGNVMDGINEFVQGAEQFDDITMLCLQYYGPESGKA